MKRIILLCLGVLSMGVAAQPVGRVLFALDKVIAQFEGKQRILTRGSLLSVGETITTGSHSSAQIKYLNGTLVTIQPKSEYRILAYAPEAVLSSELKTGAIDYKSKGKRKAVIKTPLVALAILGTKLRVIVTKNHTYLRVNQGLVRGHGSLIGPGQEATSGSFQKNGSFSPGPIPDYPIAYGLTYDRVHHVKTVTFVTPGGQMVTLSTAQFNMLLAMTMNGAANQANTLATSMMGTSSTTDIASISVPAA